MCHTATLWKEYLWIWITSVVWGHFPVVLPAGQIVDLLSDILQEKMDVNHDLPQQILNTDETWALRRLIQDLAWMHTHAHGLQRRLSSDLKLDWQQIHIILGFFCGTIAKPSMSPQNWFLYYGEHISNHKFKKNPFQSRYQSHWSSPFKSLKDWSSVLVDCSGVVWKKNAKNHAY